MTRRILIAEPSRTLTSLIRLTLAEVDAELIAVSEGHDAARALTEATPDLLITAVDLPGVDGYTLAAMLRGATHGDAPVLLIAQAHAALDQERVAYLGIDDVLVKPFERAALLARVRALLATPRQSDAPALPRSPASRPATTPPPRADRQATAPLSDDDHHHARVDVPTPVRSPAPRVADEDATRVAVAAELSRRLPAAVSAEVDRTIGERLEDTVARHTDRLVAAEIGRRVPNMLAGLVDARLGALVDGALAALVDARLPDIVDAYVAELTEARLDAVVPARIETLGAARVDRAVDALVDEAGPSVVERAAQIAVAGLGDDLLERVRRAVIEAAEPVIWKLVPEIAEDLIKSEIKRLTAEAAPDDPHADDDDDDDDDAPPPKKAASSRPRSRSDKSR